MKTLQDLKDIIEGLEAKYDLKAEDIPLSQGLVNCVEEIGRILTENANKMTGIDLDGDGVIEHDMYDEEEIDHETVQKVTEELIGLFPIQVVSKCCAEHIEERDLYKNTITGQLFCTNCNKVLFDNGVKEERFELNEGVGEILTSDTVATITTNHPIHVDDVPEYWR